jgi:hypothetical protein
MNLAKKNQKESVKNVTKYVYLALKQIFLAAPNAKTILF